MTEKRKPKRHHQVAQFYLKRFANPKEQVSAYRRSDGKCVLLNVSNASVESNFYDLVDEQGERSTVVEEELADIEGKAKVVLDRLDYDQGALSDEERVILSIYMALQLTRTRDFRQENEEVADVLGRLQVDLFLHWASREQVRALLREQHGQEPTNEEVDSFIRFRDSIEKFKVQQHQNFSIEQMVTSTIELAPLFDARPWTFLKSEKRGFLTSDRPVVLWRERTDGDRHYGVGVASATEIYFPIGPYSALLLGQGVSGGWEVSRPEPKRVRHINAEVAHWSHQWIYYHPKHDPLNGVHVAVEGPVLHINGIPIRKGANVWNQLRRQFIERTTVPVLHFGYGVDRTRR